MTLTTIQYVDELVSLEGAFMAMASSLELREEYLELLRKMDGDVEGRKAAEVHLRESYPRAEGEVLRWATNPYIIDGKQYDKLLDAAETLGAIMEKVMAKYHRDRNFRKLFGLDPKIEELTLVPSGCHAAVPLSRVDVFYDQEKQDYRILGIVTGAVNGMSDSAKVSRALWQTQAYRAFVKKHGHVGEFDPVREAVLSILHTYGKWANAEEGRNHPTHPSLAVVDVDNSPRASETKTAIAFMRDLGCYARATSFSQLRIQKVGGVSQLVDNHGPVTCVWLRATAEEAAEHFEGGMKTLSEATRHGLVCTVGGYRSWPCCTRTFLQVLQTRECRDLLSRAQNAFIANHFAKTYVLNTSMALSDFYDQENWVLRTADGHDAQHIIAGSQLSKADWRKLLVKSLKTHDAVSEYVPHEPMTVVTVDDEGKPCECAMGAMLGLYVFESKLCGIKVSAGSGSTIAHWDGPVEMACVVVKE